MKLQRKRVVQQMITYLAMADGLFGFALIAIDVYAGPPWYWIAVEGPSVAATGVLILWLQRKLRTAGHRSTNRPRPGYNAGAMNTTTFHQRIDEPYPLSTTQIARFREDGFIKLKGVFDAETLAQYGDEITRVTFEHNQYKDVPLEQRSTYGKAFIQVTNLWRKSELVREFSFGKRLARLAAELMGVAGVRMWHDQALYKEAGGGFTPWHVDQQYWPMASDKSVTAWVPLQAVPAEMGPMGFGRGSHKLNIARNMEISDDSEQVIRDEIERRGIERVIEPFELGEVSFHTGWTLHGAGPNTSGSPRRVHTVIYMDEQMRLAEPANANQKVDWEAWTPGTRVGEVMDDALNPVLYSASL